LEGHKGLFFSGMRYICILFSVLVSGVVFIRRALYRTGLLPVHTLGARVISIGNLTMGGTGKTPAVRLVAEHLTAKGEGVVIVTRGYGRTVPGQRILVDGQGRWREMGDEPLMLSRSLPTVPIIVGRDRVAGGKVAVEKFRPQFVILDDGFQHLRLARDVEVVVIDATCPFGNGRLFPGGILRENLGALQRAHLFLVTKVNQAENVGHLLRLLQQIHPHAVIVQGAYRPVGLSEVSTHTQVGLELLKGKPVLAMSGIGNPISFERSLEGLGAQLAERLRFSDHHPFRPKEVTAALRLAQETGAQYVVTTEKDRVRLPAVEKPVVPILSLDIQLRIISGEKQLWQFIERGL
jgi:tetraacyldisaccharide 4'-kinase